MRGYSSCTYLGVFILFNFCASLAKKRRKVTVFDLLIDNLLVPHTISWLLIMLL